MIRLLDGLARDAEAEAATRGEGFVQHVREARGLRVIIAAAGGAAHLPGMVAAKTLVPVLGVPVPATALLGVDALLSIVQMPKGVPVATVGVGNGENAGLLAAAILAVSDPALRERLAARRAAQAASIAADPANEGL